MPRAKTPRNNTTLNKQVIPMPEATNVPAIRKNGGAASPTPIDVEAQIRQRAYQLFEERGCAHGQAEEDWFRAEREVLSRTDRQQSA